MIPVFHEAFSELEAWNDLLSGRAISGLYCLNFTAIVIHFLYSGSCFREIQTGGSNSCSASSQLHLTRQRTAIAPDLYRGIGFSDAIWSDFDVFLLRLAVAALSVFSGVVFALIALTGRFVAG